MVKYDKNINENDDELMSLWQYISLQLLCPQKTLNERIELQQTMF